MKLAKTGLLVRRLLIIIPVVVGLTLVSLFLPAQRVTIEGIGTLSFDTTATLSVGSEVAYASPGWLSGWSYRRAITLSPATSVDDYQVLVTLDTATMGDPYANVNADGSDIRFTGSDEVTPQDYWVESWDNNGTSKIWVEVKTSGTPTIYMYYGNPGASSASDGDATFVFFDDFLGTSLDTTNKWDVINPGAGSYSVSGGLLTIQSTGDWFETTDTSLYVVSKSSFSFNYAAESLINQIGSDSYPRFFGLRASSVANSRMFVMIGDSDRSHITNVYRDSDGGNAGWYGEDSGISNPGNNKIARFERNGDTVTSYYNNSLMNTRTVTNWDLIKVALTDTLVFGTQQASKFDWIFVRKYTSPEPSATVGSEETLDISNAPPTKDFGVVTAGSTPNTGNAYFTITNSSTMTIDIYIKCDGWSPTTGTGSWTYGSPVGADQGFLEASSADGGAGGSQGAGLYDIEILNGTDTLLCDDVATTTNPTWELQLNVPSSFTHGDEQQTIVTLTATAA